MRRGFIVSGFFCLMGLLFVHNAAGEVLFEGYYVIKLNGGRVGYVINRYESIKEGKIFKATSFTNMSLPGINVTESVVTESDENFAPLKLSFIKIDNKKSSELIGEVKDGVLKITQKGDFPELSKNDGLGTLQPPKSGATKPLSMTSSTNVRQIPLPKGIFFSGILAYVILKSPQGLRTNEQYKYKTIAEELGQIVEGEARVEKEVLFRNRFKTYLIHNHFQGQTFTSWVTERGEILKTQDVASGISQELVPLEKTATKGFVVPKRTLIELFGEMPRGERNFAFLAHQKGEWLEEEDSLTIDKNTLPPGMGVHLKKNPKKQVKQKEDSK
ncbi:MAG: hypothetical protein NZ480_07050 [Bdellovibrionaceae bacterium]|nr:hypothetical protein [Pseudobdellovibrionaceae bacterium]MDW8189698.1 hypothetical protein [Pseudobdellovibrionaceae bacterium]